MLLVLNPIEVYTMSQSIYVCTLFQGATIKAEEGTGRILIARVMHGGAADRSGLISVGDEVIEVNGLNVEGKTPNDVLRILVFTNIIIYLFIQYIYFC